MGGGGNGMESSQEGPGGWLVSKLHMSTPPWKCIVVGPICTHLIEYRVQCTLRFKLGTRVAPGQSKVWETFLVMFVAAVMV